MGTTRHLADVTDPVTNEQTTLTAGSAVELEQLIIEHLQTNYPNPLDDPPHPHRREETLEPRGPGMRCSAVKGSTLP